ncbi:MAG: TadE/TadG family type IV pilus assembly protein [Ilumatobacteraceae bacterium]|nr:hypothetical protein LBMAG03_10690 [Actinomycetes bacterium]
MSTLPKHCVRSYKHSTTDTGQATVELALLLPLFVLMIVALFDVTAIARDQLQADLIARDAARQASQSTSIDEAHDGVAATVARTGRSDVRWKLTVDNDVLTVRVSLEPRTSLTASSLRWLGNAQRIEGQASFATEYDIDDQ